VSGQKLKKILVIDDEKSTTLSIASHLKNYASNYELLRAYTKEEAMENIRTHNPDLVLLDIELNGVNAGISILDFLNHEYKKTKTIIISGKAKHLKDQLEEMGCFHFFTKPVDLQELNTKIKSALGIEQVFDHKEHVPVDEKPKAKLLFVEIDLRAFAYLASIFDETAKELQNGADYKVKIETNIGDLIGTCVDFQPDIVLIGDYCFTEDQLLSLVTLVKDNIKIKPKSVIVHGLFERDQIFEFKLKKMGVKRCIQSVMNQDELLEMNRVLANAVAEECLKQRLVRSE
jgi:CheY-like chemotaxis protein